MNSKLKITLALVGMFVFGAISGIALNAFWRPYFPPPPHRGDIQRHMFEFLTERLDLTEQQQEQIKPILDDFSRQVEESHRQSVLQFDQLAQQTDSRISQLLTPEQRIKLQKIAEERERGFERHGPPPPDR